MPKPRRDIDAFTESTDKKLENKGLESDCITSRLTINHEMLTKQIDNPSMNFIASNNKNIKFEMLEDKNSI